MLNSVFYCIKFCSCLIYSSVKICYTCNFINNLASVHRGAVCNRQNIVLHHNIVTVWRDVMGLKFCMDICKGNYFVVHIINTVIPLRRLFDSSCYCEIFSVVSFGESNFYKCFISFSVCGNKVKQFLSS